MIFGFVAMTGGCGGGGGGGGSTPTPEPEQELAKAPINPDFIEWQESIRLGEPYDSGYGVIPDPIDWSHLQNIDYSLSAARGAESLPSAYDGRNNGIVTSVKNQMPHLLCWAFGTIASLESTTLKAGIANNPDFSERHLGWFTYHSDGKHVAFTNAEGWDYPGGSFGRATATLTRGTGPVREEDSLYTSNPNIDMPPAESKTYTNALAVTEVYNLSIAELAAGNALKNRQPTFQAIKELLISEGAVGVSYYDYRDDTPTFTDTYYGKYYNRETSSYYHPESHGSNHIVAIVGWDDNYSAGNFKTTPPGNGAWLIKNSWGTSHGDGGYQWISYYDGTLGGVALYKGEATGKYQNMYLYDPLGFTSATGYGVSFMWAANVFTASGNEQIEAVAFDTYDARTSYEVRIYKNPTANNPSSGELQTMATTKGSHTYAGYHTVRLEAPVPLAAGESFSVVIKISVDGTTAYFPCEEVAYYPIFDADGNFTGNFRLGNYSNEATSSPGQSFSTYVNEPNASSRWTDLYDDTYKPNFCIRALANTVSSQTVPTIETESLPDGAVETAYNQTLSASGTAPITWSVASGALPIGLSLNSATGEISGTPTTANTYSFTVKATNAAGSTEKALSIVITATPVAPMINTASLPGGTVGVAYSQTLSASGTAPITWSVASGTLPTGLSMNAATGVISGTPTTASASNFTVRATNAKGSATKALSIAVSNTNLALIIDTPSNMPSGIKGKAYNQTLVARGSAPITWTITSGTLPAGLSLNGATGVISGTPTSDGGYFTVRATNAAGSVIKTLLLSVYDSNTGYAQFNERYSPSAPSFHLPSGIVGMAYSYTFSVRGQVPITFELLSSNLPNGLSLNSATGEISGTPTMIGIFNFFVGTYNSLGNIGAGGNLFSIEITSAPVAPAINTPSNMHAGTAVGAGIQTISSYNQTLSASGSRPITWAMESGTLPDGLDLYPATGEISGNPTTAGAYNFTVRATNAVGSVTKALSITVAAKTNGNWIDVADTGWYNSEPYRIGTPEELAGLAKLLKSGVTFSGKTITLTKDINLAGRQWTPIGLLSPFSGVFEGGGCLISYMTIITDEDPWLTTWEEEGLAGLFGRIAANATVRNVKLENAHINVVSRGFSSISTSLGFPVGLIAGENSGTVSGCVSSGNVSFSLGTENPSFSGDAHGGGIVGLNNNGSMVLNCTSSANLAKHYGGLYNQGANTGGIVGRNFGEVSNCTSTGSLSHFENGDVIIGGIVGENVGGTVSNCHKPSGLINAIGAGGVIGGNSSNGSITGNDFSRVATGQTYGIGSDGRNNGQPSNVGAAPTD
jgi:C1A family cysteine protease